MNPLVTAVEQILAFLKSYAIIALSMPLIMMISVPEVLSIPFWTIFFWNHARRIQRVFSQSCLSRPFLECELSPIIATHQGRVVGLSNGLENLYWSKRFQVAVCRATRLLAVVFGDAR
ncbi:hypothetical protein SUGI_0620850 [Cryptomeria japonica]|nr:hypothetical protein SUGI_0620850 [Cryptomeria japonica]